MLRQYGMVRDMLCTLEHSPRNRGGGAKQVRTPAGPVGRQWDEVARPIRGLGVFGRFSSVYFRLVVSKDGTSGCK